MASIGYVFCIPMRIYKHLGHPDLARLGQIFYVDYVENIQLDYATTIDLFTVINEPNISIGVVINNKTK